MPLIALDKHYSRWKPPLGAEIDWSHPLTRGLVQCWLLNEGAGNTVRDLAAPTGGAVAASADWIVGPNGAVSNIQSTGDNWNIDAERTLTLAVPFSIVSRSRSNGASWHSILGESGSQAWYHYNDAGTRKFRYFGDKSLISSGISVDVWYTAACTIEATKGVIYINGIVNATTVDTFSVAFTTNWLGAVDTGTELLSGALDWIYVYDRALSASEILQLYVEPFCFLI